MLFDVRVLRVGEWSVLAVVGDMDLATLPSLRQELDRLDGALTAIDLSGVDYVDPVSLGVILTGSLRATRRGGRFTVVCPPGPARDLLTESGLDRIIQVLDQQSALD